MRWLYLSNLIFIVIHFVETQDLASLQFILSDDKWELNMSLIIKRPVILKNIVTEKFKQQLMEDLSNAVKQIDIRINQMNFQEKRISSTDKQQKKKIAMMREELRQERNRQEQIKNDLQKRLEQIPQLEVGSEFIGGNYDAPVKIEIGDNIRAKLFPAEIIVKDGIVVDIKE